MTKRAWYGSFMDGEAGQTAFEGQGQYPTQAALAFSHHCVHFSNSSRYRQTKGYTMR